MRTPFLVIALGLCSARGLLSQAPAAGSAIIACIDTRTREKVACDDASAGAGAQAGTGLNPSVAAAANSLGAALGTALVRSLFSRSNQPRLSAPQVDTAALAEAVRRARFARDKNELMAALGMNGSNGATLNMVGSAPAQLQMEGPPASGELHMAADRPPDLPPLHPPAWRPTPADIVATIHLNVGETSLLVAAPKNEAGVDIPFAVCVFSSDREDIVTVNRNTGQVRAVGPGGPAHIIEDCNNGAARAAVSVAVHP